MMGFRSKQSVYGSFLKYLVPAFFTAGLGINEGCYSQGEVDKLQGRIRNLEADLKTKTSTKTPDLEACVRTRSELTEIKEELAKIKTDCELLQKKVEGDQVKPVVGAVDAGVGSASDLRKLLLGVKKESGEHNNSKSQYDPLTLGSGSYRSLKSSLSVYAGQEGVPDKVCFSYSLQRKKPVFLAIKTEMGASIAKDLSDTIVSVFSDIPIRSDAPDKDLVYAKCMKVE